MNNQQKTITEYLDSEYAEYGKYTVENRAIPSVVDGFKPTQRKIINESIRVWKTLNEKPLKVFQLSGRCAANQMYHHGSCLGYDTPILLEDGSYILIGEWVEKFPNKKMKVVSFDEKNNKFVFSEGCFPRLGQITDVEYEILLESGELIKCTANHPFLLTSGIWKRADELLESDDILKYIK